MRKKIVVTGGSGRFGKYLGNLKTKYKIFFPSKKEFKEFKSNKDFRGNKFEFLFTRIALKSAF